MGNVVRRLGNVFYFADNVADASACIVAACARRRVVAHRGPDTVFTGERLSPVLDPFRTFIGFRRAVAPGGLS